VARERLAFTQYVGVKIGVERIALTLIRCFLPHIFPAKYHILRVEPRGFEPLTFAVQRRMHNIVVVRGCSEILANKHILPWALSPVFAWVGVKLVSTGVALPVPRRTASSFMFSCSPSKNIRSRRADFNWD
jgi:hypothetical protein